MEKSLIVPEKLGSKLCTVINSTVGTGPVVAVPGALLMKTVVDPD